MNYKKENESVFRSNFRAFTLFSLQWIGTCVTRILLRFYILFRALHTRAWINQINTLSLSLSLAVKQFYTPCNKIVGLFLSEPYFFSRKTVPFYNSRFSERLGSTYRPLCSRPAWKWLTYGFKITIFPWLRMFSTSVWDCVRREYVTTFNQILN